MACLTTRGRAINCKDVRGGLNRLWITSTDLVTTLNSDEEIDDCTSTAVFFQYDLKNSGNTMETTANVSRDNGTTYFTTVLNIVLPKLTKEDHKELKLISYGKPHLIVEDRNSNFWLLGREHGCELTSASISSGGAMGDASQYTLEFTAEEVSPPSFINGATSSNPAAGWSSCTETITVGTNS
tara:strand:- start:17 stop:565 length:549 start_codon:yes stop_codon:yes gene_type:complete